MHGSNETRILLGRRHNKFYGVVSDDTLFLFLTKKSKKFCFFVWGIVKIDWCLYFWVNLKHLEQIFFSDTKIYLISFYMCKEIVKSHRAVSYEFSSGIKNLLVTNLSTNFFVNWYWISRYYFSFVCRKKKLVK